MISGGHEQAHLAETFNIEQMKTSCLLYIYLQLRHCAGRWEVTFSLRTTFHDGSQKPSINNYHLRPPLLILQLLMLLKLVSAVM